ncbi:MAG: tetratricopeptide repeat protein [Rhodospirillales bacterium]
MPPPQAHRAPEPAAAAPDPTPPLLRAVQALSRGDAASAAQHADDVLALAPGHAAGLHVRGVAALGLGDAKTAVTWLAAAADADPGNAEVLSNLGVAHRSAGSLPEAEASLRRAIATAPNYAQAHFNLGNVLAGLNREAEAAACFRIALDLRPGYAAAANNLGLMEESLGNSNAAEAAYRAVLAQHPDHVDALINLAMLLQRTGGVRESVSLFERARRLRLLTADAENAYGAALFELGRVQEAIVPFRVAIAKDPSRPDAWVNLGNALCGLHRPADATMCYEHALATAGDDPGIRLNHGHALRQSGDIAGARREYAAALALAPDHEEARFADGVAALLTGDFAAGWRGYAAREALRRTRQGFWREALPADLAARTVIVVNDQGLGEELVFLRFAAVLRGRGARVVYRGDPRLSAMLERAGVVDALAGDEEDAADYRLSVGDLPLVLGMAAGDPVPPPFDIPALAERIAAQRALLAAAGPPPFVGVTWRAGARGKASRLSKEAPMEAVAAVLAPLAATVVVVQRHPAMEEIEALCAVLGRPAADLSACHDDLEDALALSALLDEYVCVSNTLVHLRAAQGRASRVLVPNPPEFRWMADGAESPWFPGTRVYRQGRDGTWGAALAAVGRDLATGA